MAWVMIVVAGLFETAWVICLDRSDGFRRPLWVAAFVANLAISMTLLGLAVRQLPTGAAYAAWVGIGAVGAILYGWLILGEPLGLWRAFFLAGLVACVVGVKLTSP
ncbi:MAG: multidrug efflux SMR transporter [Myxococcota bacterium]|nr:multidrug efflux SMR transporter [Myxococcota bacterium]